MSIIELPNGIKIHADSVEVSPDGTLTAYTADTEEMTPADEKLTDDLKRSVAYNQLTKIQRDTYDFMRREGGSIQISLLGDMLNISRSAIGGRLHALKEAGMVENVGHGLWRAI